MKYSIQNERFRVSALEIGAELTEFHDLSCDYEYLWQKCDVWQGQSPLLFPVVGKLKDDRYTLDGKTYEMPKHGFAIHSKFDLESRSSDEMTFVLRESEETLRRYPFPFELRVHYALRADGFRMEHRVKNTGNRKMYFSIGAHPAFQIELGDRVVMDEEETRGAYRLGSDMLRKKELTPVFDHSREIVVTRETFLGDALIFDGLKSGGASVVRANGKNVHVDFGSAPCLGVWAKPGAKYVCIEPWYGIDDNWDADGDFIRKPYILSLDPGQEFVFPVTIRV